MLLYSFVVQRIQSSLANSLARRGFVRNSTFPCLCDPPEDFYLIEIPLRFLLNKKTSVLILHKDEG